MPRAPVDDGYYANTRADVVRLLPRPLGRVLDVGCGSGGVGPGLLAAGATELTGVEVVARAAEEARTTYDRVVCAPIEDALAELDGPFDTVLCLDVLEHLVAPDAVVAALLDRTQHGGHLQVSVPNARHFSLVYDLVVRGTFGYTDWGHRDRTHLRWFTRRDILRLIEAAGWRPTAVSHPPLKYSRVLDRVTRRRSTEFLVGQWYVTARRP